MPDVSANQIICAWESGPPATVAFCETRTCDFPSEPANAWSNIAYIIVGLYVLYLAKKEARWNLWPGGATAIGIGIGSFAFHAYPNFYMEYADLVAMFLLSTYLLSVQLYRLLEVNAALAVRIYFAILGASCVALWVHKDIGIAIFAVQLVLATGVEVVLFRRHPKGQPRHQYRDFWTLIVVFLVALLIWVLDLTGVVCDPDNHFLQGHAFWHIINSTCLYWMYRYGRQFEWSKS